MKKEILIRGHHLCFLAGVYSYIYFKIIKKSKDEEELEKNLKCLFFTFYNNGYGIEHAKNTGTLLIKLLLENPKVKLVDTYDIFCASCGRKALYESGGKDTFFDRCPKEKSIEDKNIIESCGFNEGGVYSFEEVLKKEIEIGWGKGFYEECVATLKEFFKNNKERIEKILENLP